MPLLGPVFALYLLADAASDRGGLSAIAWAVAVVAVALTATPLWLRGLVEGEVRGARRTAALGVLMGLTLAAGLGPLGVSLTRDLTLAAALSFSGVLVLDLGFRVPDVISRRGRALMIVGALASTLAATAAVLPPFELWGELILAPARLSFAPPAMMLGAMGIALAARLFRRRFGSTPEALASNAWAVMGLLPSFGAGLAAMLLVMGETLPRDSVWVSALLVVAAPILLFGHITAIDSRRRPRAGFEVRRYVAATFTMALVAAAAAFLYESLPRDPVTFTVAAALWWVGSVALWRGAQRAVHRLLAPYGGRLLDAVERVREGFREVTSLEEIAGRVLPYLRDASGDRDADPVLWVVDPGREARIDAARNARVRSAAFPPSVQAVFEETPGRVVVAREVHAVVVRRPERRALSELLDAQEALCVVPLVAAGELEGALVVPRGRRGSALSLEEIEGLRTLGAEIAAMISLVTARDRAQRRVGELAQQRDGLEERLEDAEIELDRLQADTKALSAGRGAGRRGVDPVAYSPAMRALEARIADVAPMDAPITLVAEGGTPIDRVARALHRRSNRAAGPFVVADCASVTADVAEAALFGDDDHPGWIRLADGGSLLLADVVALSLGAQHALAEALSVRQGRPADGGASYAVDARVIATSRVPLEPLVEAGLFDPELARWLTRVHLEVPPLRERPDDIPSLVLLALDRSCRVLGRDPVGVAQGALEVLLQHDWPGNLRELQHVIDRAVAACTGQQVQRGDLPALVPRAARSAQDPLDGTYAELERRVLVRAMKKAGGNKSEAARILGLKRTTFLDKLRRHQIGKNAEDAA
ncbi:MAG: sigma 54-interacting transcriptional regulator [Myxococcota bacterium]